MSSTELLHPSERDVQPAPYGRACTNCARSKCKCVIVRGERRCQRCERLDRECRPSLLNGRRNPRRPIVSRTARLEEKLEDLVSLLRTGAHPGIATTSGPSTAIAEDGHRDTETNQPTSPSGPMDARIPNPLSNHHHHYHHHHHISHPHVPIPNTNHSSSAHSTPTLHLEPTALEAEENLSVFRLQMSHYFPFIHIHSKMSAHQLRQERPFLWRCIMAASSRMSRQQRALYEQIKHIASQHVLHEFSTNGIDLLLGILVYIGWSSQQVVNRPNLSIFTQLAKSLVFELGLNKPASKDGPPWFIVHPQPPVEDSPPTRTMEERRAVLGCFLITSTISSFLQKIDALRWTSHLDECLLVLDERQESPNDEILIHQVKCQLVIERMTVSSWHGGSAETMQPLQAPPSVYLHALQSRLHTSRSKTAHRSLPYRILLLHLYNTTLTLNESMLFSSHHIVSSDLNFQKLESLYASLDAIKSWFDLFFSISSSDYVNFPFTIFSQLIHCLVALYRLSTLDDPAWDKTAVRQTADVLLILDRLVENMAQVATGAGLNGDPDDYVFSRLSKMYTSMRTNWESKLLDPLISSTDEQIPSFLETVPVNDPFPTQDNGWLLDIFGSAI